MEVKEKVMLAPYTNFRVGGPARFFAEAKSVEDIKAALKFAQEKSLPISVLGGGTNVLISDAGFDGLILRVTSYELRVIGSRIDVGAGATMGQVVAAAQKAGLTGLEWAAGLPGTVGGAVYGNSGCFGGEIKDVIESVQLLNPLDYELRVTSYELLEPSYRHSQLKETGDIVLSATFGLRKGSAEEITASIDKIRAKAKERIAEQPLGARTAGSTFKGVALTPSLRLKIEDLGLNAEQGSNRAGFLSAGWLVEQAGLKGHKTGNASFSDHHANFIINHGSATAKDIVSLIALAKCAVKEKFGIDLEEEIRYIGL
ncbi:MAG: UDP-N-acetylmuramate dehydrogenase [bacterium]|nr:UDP-N-acetylmuramate dehydrogenase [bacterium]